MFNRCVCVCVSNMRMCVCACVCYRMCVCACVCVLSCVCVSNMSVCLIGVCVCVFNRCVCLIGVCRVQRVGSRRWWRAAALEEDTQRAADLCSVWTADRRFRSAALGCLRPDQLRSHDRHQRIHRSHTHTHTHTLS